MYGAVCGGNGVDGVEGYGDRWVGFDSGYVFYIVVEEGRQKRFAD